MADMTIGLVMPVLRALFMDLGEVAQAAEPLDRRAPLLRLREKHGEDQAANQAAQQAANQDRDGAAAGDSSVTLDLTGAVKGAERALREWDGVDALTDAVVDTALPVLRAHVGKIGTLPDRVRLPGIGDVEVTPDAGGLPAGVRPSVAGKVVVVTGGAQGFGAEIARGLARAGAHLVLADLNLEGARTMAEELNSMIGRPVAHALKADVSAEDSVAELIHEVAALAGGIDLFISNAGVLKAGSVKELSVGDFDFVTSVNYKGFFVCSKHASRLMSIQDRARMRAAEEPFFSDIIQINSKSGLDGSNKNGAYAGGKFGGIGLVQSFAKELVENHIKVNAICPGNFFDGPLWSDPEKGLFVQYLRAGKVPGAETVAEVKQFYEAKVPMGRGCTGPDVVKAILYAVDQRYETGQAIPVTGGQIMLR